jgi:hypothetical protein
MTTATESEFSIDEISIPEKEMTAEEFETWAFAQELARCEWVDGRVDGSCRGVLLFGRRPPVSSSRNEG